MTSSHGIFRPTKGGFRGLSPSLPDHVPALGRLLRVCCCKRSDKLLISLSRRFTRPCPGRPLPFLSAGASATLLRPRLGAASLAPTPGPLGEGESFNLESNSARSCRAPPSDWPRPLSCALLLYCAFSSLRGESIDQRVRTITPLDHAAHVQVGIQLRNTGDRNRERFLGELLHDLEVVVRV